MTLHSSINLINPQTGQRFPSAPDSSVVLSSSQAGWRQNLTLEVHRLQPMELPEHYIEGHRLIINLGEAVRFGWRMGGRTHEAILPHGGFCLQSNGETNAPFWQDELTVAAIALTPDFITTILEDRTPTAIDTFAERRCSLDELTYNYARALSRELASPGEPLYAETLSLAFTLHLLSNHSRKVKKPLSPKGKLSSIQLKEVIEYTRTQLGAELSLNQLADVAQVSEFYFSRLFKNTTGMAPHQFVLNLRLERAKKLILTGQMSLAEVALLCGFFDQSHFSNVFKRAFGMTPRAFAN
ncbi:MAG: helix-turn-helix transcriptional regulator [Scytonema sp. RU_4_4]|nr:helix-turn-helix transcriptional regulator [Scytonema sp. RU_4_4]NJR72539.1 helix-turn-helix transcriptional regulator [Scytonema sp. CRU_2_7]